MVSLTNLLHLLTVFTLAGTGTLVVDAEKSLRGVATGRKLKDDTDTPRVLKKDKKTKTTTTLQDETDYGERTIGGQFVDEKAAKKAAEAAKKAKKEAEKAAKDKAKATKKKGGSGSGVYNGFPSSGSDSGSSGANRVFNNPVFNNPVSNEPDEFDRAFGDNLEQQIAAVQLAYANCNTTQELRDKKGYRAFEQMEQAEIQGWYEDLKIGEKPFVTETGGLSCTADNECAHAYSFPVCVLIDNSWSGVCICPFSSEHRSKVLASGGPGGVITPNATEGGGSSTGGGIGGIGFGGATEGGGV